MPAMADDPRDHAPVTAREVAIECKVKGQSFRAFLAALDKLEGRRAVVTTIANLPQDVRHAIENQVIVTSGWYPMSWYVALHAAAKRACPGVVGLARQLGRAQTRAEVQGIYKFILGFIKPGLLMQNAGRLFAMYCRGGKLTVTDAESTYVRLVYEDCHGSDANVWEDVIGSTEAMLEAAGAHAVRSFLESGGGEGDPMMTLQLRWSVGA